LLGHRQIADIMLPCVKRREQPQRLGPAQPQSTVLFCACTGVMFSTAIGMPAAIFKLCSTARHAPPRPCATHQ
jgi:hypothetical protein